MRMFQAYRDGMERVMLSGPTLFAPLLRAAVEIARSANCRLIIIAAFYFLPYHHHHHYYHYYHFYFFATSTLLFNRLSHSCSYQIRIHISISTTHLYHTYILPPKLRYMYVSNYDPAKRGRSTLCC